jgi:L-alanine-DL-glutamate epimerase-like enolase superfamily enzyme
VATALDRERLARIEPIQLRSRYPRRIGRNARLFDHGDGVDETAVVLRTESGATGWGLLAWSLFDLQDDRLARIGDELRETGVIDFAVLAEVERDAGRAAVEQAQSLLGRSIGDLFDPQVGVVDDAALPFDAALHDLAGVILGVPVYELLGAAASPQVRCYDGAIYHADLDPPERPSGVEAVLACCADDYEWGFRAFKLKIGRGFRWLDPEAGLQRDVEVTRAVRRAFPDCALLVDANDGYTADGFAVYLDAVLDCDLYWIEEPFPEAEGDLRALRTRLAGAGSAALIAEGEAPIAEGETSDAIERRFLELAGQGLVDVALFDVLSYGLTPWRRLMPQLLELGVQGSPHTWGSPLKTLYASHLAAGLGNIPIIEGVPGVTDGVDASGYRLANGILGIPAAPGFGLSLPGER